MAFRFLHTSDLHIGRSFGGFTPEVATLLKRVRVTVIDRLATAARDHGAGDIFVCGDIFDGPGLADKILRETMARFGGHRDLTWHLLPGNHDPAQVGGLWDRVQTLGLPLNVKLLLTAAPIVLKPEVVLLPAPLTSKSSSVDPTAWMDDVARTERVVRVGIAHGSTQSFGGSAASSIGVDPRRRLSAGLDYLALGDWHGVREIADGVWYSGTPEPDQFPDNEPGHALAVEILGTGAPAKVVRVATAAHLWMKHAVTLTDASGLDPVEALIADLGPRRSETLLELSLSGIITRDADLALDDRLAVLEASLFQLRLRREQLRVDADGGGSEAISDAQLADVARQLEAMRHAATGADTAEGALRRLHQLNRKWAGSYR